MSGVDQYITVYIDNESVERLDRLCDRFDTFRSDIVEVALEVFENLADAGMVKIDRKSNLSLEE